MGGSSSIDNWKKPYTTSAKNVIFHVTGHQICFQAISEKDFPSHIRGIHENEAIYKLIEM